MQSYIKAKLKIKCIIGILDFERKKKQRVQIKLKAKSDGFLDYAELISWLKEKYKDKRFALIEDSFEFIFREIKDEYPHLKYLKITLYKLDIIKNAKVGASSEKFY